MGNLKAYIISSIGLFVLLYVSYMYLTNIPGPNSSDSEFRFFVLVGATIILAAGIVAAARRYSKFRINKGEESLPLKSELDAYSAMSENSQIVHKVTVTRKAYQDAIRHHEAKLATSEFHKPLREGDYVQLQADDSEGAPVVGRVNIIDGYNGVAVTKIIDSK